MPPAAAVAALSFFAFCSWMMASISSSRSLSTNSPLLVLRPHVFWWISSSCSGSGAPSRMSDCE